MSEVTPTAQKVAASVPWLAGLRLAFAVVLATRPGESRLVAARELALGLGALTAYRRDEPVSGWVAAMAVADGSDAAAFLAEARQPEARRRALWMAAFAASGLVSEGLTAWALRRAGR